jgi:hypothetical protein
LAVNSSLPLPIKLVCENGFRDRGRERGEKKRGKREEKATGEEASKMEARKAN